MAALCCTLHHLVPVPPAEARAGDVLLFSFRAHLPARHCAIVTGQGTMIHAHDGAAVTEVALTRWWRRHCTHAFHFPEGAARSRQEGAPG